MPATLVFIKKGDQVLLIEKQRGIGAGKINGPGGKIDPGETPLECAIREVQEELLITVSDPVKMGELYFDMSDIPNILCHVFLATEFTGTPTATEEAVPLWTPITEIPFDLMWEDDQHWLSDMLAGKKFIGKFIFEGEVIQWMDLKFDSAETQDW